MSERLQETQRFYEPKPRTLFIRLWHIMNGSVFVAGIALCISLSSFVARIFYDIKDHSSLYFGIGFVSVIFAMVHVNEKRESYVDVSESAIAAALALEMRLNHKQMQKMMKSTRTSRILISLVFVDTCLGPVFYSALPLWRHTHLAPMPFLPDIPFYFWSMYLVQSVVLTVGPIAAFSLLAFHLEVSLCLTCMNKILDERFQKVSTQEIVKELIQIHQLLLNASKKFEQLSSTVWFWAMMSLLFMLIVNTYIIITLSFQVLLMSLIATFFFFLSEPCILGEMISSSSAKIGFSAYESDWVNTVPGSRRDLALVILRCQKPVCLTAGLIGKLDLRKLMSFMKNWYKFVQALSNFSF